MKGEIRYVIPTTVPVPTAEAVGAATIADWFGSDIQYSERTLDEWLTIFNEVADGDREPGYQGTGNTHSVMATDEWVFIECEYLDNQKVLLTRQQVTDALEQYRLFLNSDYKSNKIIPTPFIVEYEAEGEEALNRYLEAGGSLGA